MKPIYERGVDTRELFRIEAASDGGYFAVRDEQPRFALWGKTIHKAVAVAVGAIAAAAQRGET